MNRRFLTQLFLIAWVLSGKTISLAQTVPPSPAAEASFTLPFTSQLKKTVTLLQTDCAPKPGALASLPLDEQLKWNRHLLAAMKPDSLAVMKPVSFGTGFFVTLQDPRLNGKAQFLYLVTNRHVVQPGVEDGTPCTVLGYHLFTNLKPVDGKSQVHISEERFGTDAGWVFPEDSSVDLAVMPIVSNTQLSDSQWISTDQFVTQEQVEKNTVVEGDPVIFAGLFMQYRGATRFEPVVRSGALAMLPTDLIDTTLRKPGKIYLAEAHSYGGNSGSPMFVDIRRFSTQSPGGYDYRLLGVVSGFVHEDSNFTLQIATDYKGTVVANSGICVVVPAEEIMKIINSSALQVIRDRDVKAFADAKKN